MNENKELTFEEVMSLADEQNVRFEIHDTEKKSVKNPYMSEALYYLPLISLNVLLLIRSKTNGYKLNDMNEWVVGIFKNLYGRLSESGLELLWSISMKRKIADAVVFLEATGLVVVSDSSARMVKITKEGRALINQCLKDKSEQGVLLRKIRAALEECKAKGIELG